VAKAKTIDRKDIPLTWLKALGEDELHDNRAEGQALPDCLVAWDGLVESESWDSGVRPAPTRSSTPPTPRRIERDDDPAPMLLAPSSAPLVSCLPAKLPEPTSLAMVLAPSSAPSKMDSFKLHHAKSQKKAGKVIECATRVAELAQTVVRHGKKNVELQKAVNEIVAIVGSSAQQKNLDGE